MEEPAGGHDATINAEFFHEGGAQHDRVDVTREEHVGQRRRQRFANAATEQLITCAVEGRGAAAVHIRDFEVGNFARCRAHGAQQEDAVHIRLHGVLQAVDPIAQRLVLLHTLTQCAVQQMPAGDRDDERRGRQQRRRIHEAGHGIERRAGR